MNRMINKQWPPFGAEICSEFCPGTLSIPSSKQFSESEHIFKPNEASLRIFFATRVVLEIGEYHLQILQF